MNEINMKSRGSLEICGCKSGDVFWLLGLCVGEVGRSVVNVTGGVGVTRTRFCFCQSVCV